LAAGTLATLIAIWFGLRYWVEQSATRMIYASSQPARAVEMLEGWGSWLGSPTSLRWLLAEAHRKTGDRGRVQRISDALAAEGVESIRANAPVLLMDGAAGAPQRVKEKMGPLLQIYSDRGSEVMASMVQGFFSQGDSQSSANALRLWGELFENDFQMEYWQGVLATQRYDLETAVQAFQRSIALNPEFPKARQELAEVYIELAKFEEAKTNYQWLHESDPGNNDYITGYARCLLNLGYPEQAVEQLQKLRDVSRLASPELALVCETNLEAGKADEASRQADILLKRWPDALPYLQLQARCKAKLGEQSESERLFARAAESQIQRPEVDRLLEQLAIDAGNHALRMSLGETMMRYLDPAGGIGYIQVASRTVPGDLRAHRLLASYYDREGKSAIAEVHRRAVQRIELAMQEAAAMQLNASEPPSTPRPPNQP
jgi:predicted Zn-dependent protease